ncbi:hypothetical protein SYNTR_1622 [Candidatus Syntrophocurvum alkaliphilum]|uniref:Peptidase S8/S53 domain-containing protein n=1 Tax=Candidatus Syntrophocurvum alkaliphilum TaxID=2293317 RepID=A0A6I6DC83_9FIRM|nr:S8 family peptidase [Candidatus Syntrophocurvum alkaliphilum]QGU00216.1 hypothetical protein SYNTR_1622 [Candidatus Syntrophocurvum alkaliphilum]
MRIKKYKHIIKGVYEDTLDIRPWSPPGVSLIAARRIWPSTRGENTVVAVLDTGIDYTHPDLEKNIIDGISFIRDEKDYMDYDGHGTHIAGTIAANKKLLGVAPETKILAVKVLNRYGIGSFQDITNGIRWVRNWRGEKGEVVNIINLSLGSSIPNTAMHKEIKKAYESGISIVCAAGNDSDIDNEVSIINFPAYYQESISVGAVDIKTNYANFSNTNDMIDLVAVGVDTYSTYPGGKYTFLSGTSMAAPHISGALALIYSRFFKRFKMYPSPEWVKLLLHFQSIDLGESGFNELVGYGLFSFNPDGGKNINFIANEKRYCINDKTKLLKSAPLLYQGDLYLPIQNLSDILSSDSNYLNEQKDKLEVYT